MPSNTPRESKAQQRDASRQKALDMRAAQQKKAKRSRLLAISGLVAAVAVLAIVVAMILSQAKPTASDLDEENPLQGITAPAGALDNGAIPVGADGTAGSTSGADAPTVAVYFDYLCPYCARFEDANAATLDKMASAGEITVAYHPISILDRLSSGTEYSTRAAQAVAFVADADPEHFVALHEALFANQPAENTAGLSDEEIAALAVEVGVPQDIADQIVADGGAFTTWVAAATAQGQIDGVSGTPTIMINGEKTADTLDIYTAGPLEEAIRAAMG
ncbi:DsbA family protein [Pengzhenrongella frigida]|uniref:Disulfide bond formation protein DsbA n=1 Tax=Pengzhenrongella frigida TaxID=1259133 RepID=A0A4Q5N593_9MICO|nr:thioredoxin domain-containing protein [Cellulomonas sp. HLT2-17]RYV51241.1 disulfide bond formation protein DsbA [Cellulomonas sp. HLT2-17]